MDKQLILDIRRMIDISCLLLMGGSFIQTFVFNNQEWLVAMFLSVVILCLFPRKEKCCKCGSTKHTN